MWTKTKRWLTAGVPIPNPIERSQAPMLQIALITVLLLLVLISPLILEQPSLAQQRVDVLSLVLVLLGIALSILVLRRAHFQAAITLFSTTFLVFIGSRLIVLGIVRNPVLIVALLVPIVLAGLLARRRTLVALAALSVLLLGIGLWVLYSAGTAPPTFEYRRILTTYTAIVVVLVVILERFGVSLRTALLAALAREQEHVQLQAALEALVAERQQAEDTLRHLSDGLEARVLERTAQLTRVNEELAREIIAREQAETRFRALLESAPDAIVIINEQGIITLVNSQLETLFGYPRAHVIGQSVEVLVPERFRGHHAGQRAAYFTAPRVREMGAGLELYGLRQDGSEFPVEIRLSPVALSDGLLVKAAIRDITVRKQIEADLRESQERFAVLFRNSPAGITLTRLRDGQYLDVNERFLGMVGFERDEVIGRTAVDLGLLTVEMRQQMAQQLHTEGVIHDLEVNIRIKAGDVRIFSASWEVVEVGDEACGLSILHDITERTQIQMALRASEDRFAKAFHSSPAALTITRLADSVFIDVNASFLALFEYERDEVIGRRSTDLAINTNPDERAGLMEHLRQHGVITNYEMILRTKSNQLRTILLSTDPLDLDGQEHVLTTMLDITPRKQMEVALRERETTLRTLFEVLPVGIAMVDRERRIVDTNPALERILEITKDDLARGIYADRTYIHPDGTALRLEEFPSLRAMSEQRAILDVEMGVILESGQTRWTSVSAAPLAVADLGVVIVTTDITERRQVEAALTQERDLLQALMDHSPDCIYFKDTASRFTRINQAQARVLGVRDASEAIGKTDADFYPPQFAVESSMGEQLLLRTGQPLIDRPEFSPEADGQPRWFSVTKVPMYDHSEGVIGLIGIARDITGRIQAEAALQQANAYLSARVDQLALLNELEEQLQACVSIQEVYDVTAVLASHLFRTEVGVVAVINSSRTRVEPVAVWGEPPAAAPTFGLDDCWALRRGQPHVVSDGHASIRCPHVTDHTTAFSICIPLLAQGEALGVLSLRPGPTTALASFDEVQQLLRVVADGVALAIANLRLREALRQQSIRDPLTEVFNRRYMEESLERELLRAARTQTSVGIIMLDVDHFKRINDRYGHDTGDAVLRQLGSFLKDHTRGDDIACRYGGEEFTLILPAATREQSRIRAEQLRQEFKLCRLIHASTFIESITLSFGVAAYPDHGTSRDVVLRAADTALYRAKHAGRDCVIVAE